MNFCRLHNFVYCSFKYLKKNYSAQAAATSNLTGIPLEENGLSASIPNNNENRKISPEIERLVEQIVSLPLIDISDLNYALKKRLNIPDATFMPTNFVPQAASPTTLSEQVEENSGTQQISFTVKLVGFDDTKKIPLIKHIRDVIPGLNLVQAKKFVESLPADVKNDLGKTEADELKSSLEKVGAKVEIV